MLPALGKTLPALETHRADFRSGCVDRAELRRNRTGPCHLAQARAHDGRRRDRDERAGQGLGIHPPNAGRRGALIKGSGGKRPAAPRLDSERFRSTPRTLGRFRDILSLR